MKRALVALLSLLAVPAFAQPNTRGILSVVNLAGFAHACPIGPKLAITARHVVDADPLKPEVPMYPQRWFQDVPGASEHGILDPIRTSGYSDLALAESDDTFAMYYSIAAEAPKPGDTLTWLSYNFAKRSRAFDRKPLNGKVARVFAGMIVMDEETVPGSSGSCVLNDRNEVVAIVSRGIGTDDMRETALFEAIYGPWYEHAFPPPKPKKQEEAQP